MPDFLVLAALGVLATLGGGPLTVLVFRLADRGRPEEPRPTPAFPDLHRGPLEGAADRLRGGAWIGALERVAIYASVVAGWREMVALALAIKGLGRYPELRSGDDPAVAERFIIGTFVSVLWACACAALARTIIG
ncbi:hypothetical protein [Barrientosiimonas humi]|uniref:hypothetical protein n=1 Tax=Barrientosiimonas humi TaxID=999931 RepID=UPI00370DA86A